VTDSVKRLKPESPAIDTEVVAQRKSTLDTDSRSSPRFTSPASRASTHSSGDLSSRIAALKVDISGTQSTNPRAAVLEEKVQHLSIALVEALTEIHDLKFAGIQGRTQLTPDQNVAMTRTVNDLADEQGKSRHTIVHPMGTRPINCACARSFRDEEVSMVENA